MLSARELAYGLYGAYRLARLDRHGMVYFEATVEGFWRSFYAAAVVAPGYIILLLLHPGESPVGVSWLRISLIEGIAYVIGWVAFPLAVFYLAQAINRSEEYIGYIVAYNWAQVLQIGLLLPATAVSVGGLVPSGLGLPLGFMVMVAILFYQWFIAKTALGVAAVVAAGLVFLDLVLGGVIGLIAGSMIRPGAGT